MHSQNETSVSTVKMHPSPSSPTSFSPVLPRTPHSDAAPAYTASQHAAAAAFHKDLHRHCATLPRLLSAYSEQQLQLRRTARTLSSHLSRLLLLPSTASPVLVAFPSLPSLLSHRLLQEIDLAVSVLTSTLAGAATTLSSLSSTQATIATAASGVQSALIEQPLVDGEGKGKAAHRKQRSPQAEESGRGQADVRGVGVVELLLLLDDAVYALHAAQQRQTALVDAVVSATASFPSAAPATTAGLSSALAVTAALAELSSPAVSSSALTSWESTIREFTRARTSH